MKEIKDKSLKPCPFCGNEAGIREAWENVYAVGCKQCGCSTPLNKDKEWLIRVWNKRV